MGENIVTEEAGCLAVQGRVGYANFDSLKWLDEFLEIHFSMEVASVERLSVDNKGVPRFRAWLREKRPNWNFFGLCPSCSSRRYYDIPNQKSCADCNRSYK